MSRLADRAVAAFGTALLPPEHGGPAPAQFVERVGRYVEQLPATQRFAVRAGVLSLAAASYLTTGRSLPRLNPADRARVLGRIAAVGPDMGAAVEGLKAIVLLANGADAYADELLARAQGHDPARPDAALTVTSSTDSPAVVTTDAVIVGSGAGGPWPRARWHGPASASSCSRRAALDGRGVPHHPPDRPICRPLPRRRGHHRAGPPVGGAADGPGGRRHHRGQLRHLLSAARCGATALAPRVRA
ncbi:hypothetical protein BZL29_6493 [Mycobacterium kansasii]|uniref:Uncharacterized protein n=1 Tax=Mycobacterium kansasii TaxID=1768 RepID=A0A1V3WRN2_MYCKA|nr:hypothetical protein BZL29_6493 [Mycobacterium kansasii]